MTFFEIISTIVANFNFEIKLIDGRLSYHFFSSDRIDWKKKAEEKKEEKEAKKKVEEERKIAEEEARKKAEEEAEEKLWEEGKNPDLWEDDDEW